MSLLSTAEIAEVLRVHPETIRRLVRARRIPYFKISPTEYRFDTTAVLAALAKETEHNDD